MLGIETKQLAIYIYFKLKKMKKLLLLTTIITVVTLTASAQIKIKGIAASKFRVKATSAMRSQAGQKGMKAIAPGEECAAYTETKTREDGSKYVTAKEFLIISNDGTTGFAFTMYTAMYKESKLIVLRGLPLEPGVCVDNTTKVTFTFDDGTTAVVKNFEDANCKGVVTTYFGSILKNDDVLEALKTKNVRSIKLEGVEKTIVKGLTEGNQLQLQGTLKCM